MANVVHKFKDRDIKRVIKATQQAGIEVNGVEVDPHTGKIKIITGKGEISQPNPWLAADKP